MSHAAVIIPVYKNELSEYEIISLKQCVKVLSNHSLFFVSPSELDLSVIPLNKDFRIERFNKEYFNGLRGYNRLMLSEEFYKRFSSYEYLLIYQLDAFVFSDQLNFWTEKDYDYIGAPWIRETKRIFLNLLVKQSLALALDTFIKHNLTKAVGNGGFSLRKVESFLSALSQNKTLAENWKANEDYFWALAAKLNGSPLKIPAYKEAALFAFEMYPSKLYKVNNNTLPFGAHAWNKYETDFYRPHFAKFGYGI